MNLSMNRLTHLRSDVPYCLFFSGGIDSMLLLYHMIYLEKNMTAYSVSFDDGLDYNLNNITKNFNVDHIKLILVKMIFGIGYHLLQKKLMSQLLIMLFYPHSN